MTHVEAGRRGGKSTLARHGRGHFVKLAQKWHVKYRLVPCRLNDFKIVVRATGEVLPTLLSGQPY